jgi:hypothetical protein
MRIKLDCCPANVAYYEVDAKFYPGSAATFWDPAEGAEVAVESIVRVRYKSGLDDVITYDTLVIDFALAGDLSFADAENALNDALVEKAVEIYRDNYDGPPDGEAWSGGFAANH